MSRRRLLFAGAVILALSTEARAGLFGPSDSYQYDPPPAWVGQDIAAIKRINDDCAVRWRAGEAHYSDCGRKELDRLDKQLRDADWCDGDVGMIFLEVGGLNPDPFVHPVHCSDLGDGHNRRGGPYPHLRRMPEMGYTINADTGQLVPRCDDYLVRRLNRTTPSDQQRPDPEWDAALKAHRCE